MYILSGGNGTKTVPLVVTLHQLGKSVRVDRRQTVSDWEVLEQEDIHGSHQRPGLSVWH